MTELQPDPAPGGGASDAPGSAGVPAAADDTMGAIAGVSLRLLAGTVSRKNLEALKRTVLASPAEYPWQVVNKVVLAEPVDEHDLAQKGLRAHRDWILRGGREQPGKPMSLRAKTLLAKLLVQVIFVSIYSLVLLVLLLVLRHKWPGADIYRLLAWLYELFPALVPK